MKKECAYEWAVCIISSRESINTLWGSINAVLNACSGRSCIVDVVINGNNGLKKELQILLKEHRIDFADSIEYRLWHIETADKANAFNEYFYNIWPGSNAVFIVDGYSQPWKDAFTKMDDALKVSENALAVTAVPSEGRSAACLREQLIMSGGIHGNLFALKQKAVLMMREKKFRLPLGLYRTDPTLGAALAFRLDPEKYAWDLKEVIKVVPEASWSLPAKQFSAIGTLTSFVKRRIRQGQGALENMAVKDYLAIRKRAVADFPVTVESLIDGFMTNKKLTFFVFLIKNPFSACALFNLKFNSKASVSCEDLQARQCLIFE